MRSFDLVDFKVAEADFFIKKLSGEATDPTTIAFYFSAYVAAARSITFCLQAVLNNMPGFSKWYQQKQDKLKQDSLARFFVEARNLSQKVGVVPIQSGSVTKAVDGRLCMKFYFARKHPDFDHLPDLEVIEACRSNFCRLLYIVYDCYVDFGTEIDPHQHYTKINVERQGRNIEDVDEELMGIRGWTYVEGWPEEYRWQLHRNQLPGCRISHLFEEYLNLTKPHPPDLPENPEDFDGISWVPPCIRTQVA